MKRILILGAGQSTPYLVSHLLERTERENWFVTVGDVDVERARRRVGDHPRGNAIHFDVDDAGLRATEIAKTDVVVNMLAPAYQNLVAWDCVNHGRHMISASYREKAVRHLDTDARRRGVLLLCEMGLDPGIDHMSAMSLIRRIRADGGSITAFRSYGGGLPAPDLPHNPLRYVVTWNPRNVATAGQEGAQYMEDGRIKIVPFHQVFHHTWPVEVEGIGRLEAYPNRDSLAYMQHFGLDRVKTMIRGSLRYPGWSETWAEVVRLGLPNETVRIPNLPARSPREVVEMFLPRNASGPGVEQRLAGFLQISPTGRIMANLTWLGLLSAEPTGCDGQTAADMLTHLLATKLALPADQHDIVVIVHEIDVEYPERDRPAERVTGTMLTRGERGGFTAMSRSVGLPAAIAVELLLRDELALTGSFIPTHPAIYEPVLGELEAAGLRLDERRSPLG